MNSQSVFVQHVYLDAVGIIVGKLEKDGPLHRYFKNYIEDSYFGESTFELAQKKLSYQSIQIALRQSKYESEDIEIAIGGDLSNQIHASTSSVEKYSFPYIGVYAACASFVLSMILGSIYIDKQITVNALCFTSSHLGVSEKQFRYPNEYGIQKCDTNTTTLTGGVALILTKNRNKIKINSFTVGKVVDVLSKNVNDMGTCMAYAALDTFKTHLTNLNKNLDEYDQIITGDLSLYGSKIFIEEAKKMGYFLEHKHSDCGSLIYDITTQDVNAGGSGPTCCPVVTFSYFLDKMLKGEMKRILVIATGALHSQISYQQKQSIPCIAHAIELEVNYAY